jgi:predicted DsbA family dithiol-disulfide isomerase
MQPEARSARGPSAASDTVQPATSTPSAIAEAAQPLVIDVVSDVVCPWCYIGKRKLEAAIAELRRGESELEAQVRWHPFQLNPDLPASGIPRSEYLAAKFGGASRAADIYARVRAVGAEVGIPFAFERIARQPNTLDAHRLIAWAQQRGDADALVEHLFQRYFVAGGFVGDRDELVASAVDAGLPGEAARALLGSDTLVAEVEAEDREARESGITGVPFFIFNGRTAVVGAHDPPALLQAIAAARIVPPVEVR